MQIPGRCINYTLGGSTLNRPAQVIDTFCLLQLQYLQYMLAIWRCTAWQLFEVAARRCVLLQAAHGVQRRLWRSVMEPRCPALTAVLLMGELLASDVVHSLLHADTFYSPHSGGHGADIHQSVLLYNAYVHVTYASGCAPQLLHHSHHPQCVGAMHNCSLTHPATTMLQHQLSSACL